ncbi:uncharacterized protein LOC135954196 [Calliphora vicina]|uniref:uncharacterized protein LOC135954196 n=1 Tax=Calliphora vicina TaxID=7373 RepID=UPI00325A7526
MDMDEKLIKEVRCRTILYDLGHSDYTKLKKKEYAWREVAAKVNLSESECKKRWKGLRDSYKRCKRMQQASGSSGETSKRKWRYFETLKFLDNVKRSRPNSKYNELYCNDDAIQLFVDNSSNSSKHHIIYKEESEDYQNYNENITDKEIQLTSKFCDNNEESEHEEITSEPAKKIETLPQIADDPIYCNNYFTHNVTSDDNEDVNRVDKSASDLCDNISNLLEKYIQTEEDDNDLFLKMIGKKMKSLPLTVKYRLQERFLKEVNDEIRKINVKI